MPYFDTVTDRSVLSRWPLPPSQHINKAAALPAASSWSTGQLRAARLVVRSATSRSQGEPDHVLPDLREQYSVTGHGWVQLCALLPKSRTQSGGWSAVVVYRRPSV